MSRKSLRSLREAVASEIAEAPEPPRNPDKVQKLHAHLKYNPIPGNLFIQLIDLWLEDQMAEGKRAMVDRVGRVILPLRRLCEDKRGVTEQLLIEFLEERGGRSAVCKFDASRWLHHLLRWIVANDYAAAMPQIPKVPCPPPPMPRRPYTHAEYLALRDSMPDLSWRWLVVACYNLGLRSHTVCHLKWENVDRINRMVRVMDTKTERFGILTAVPYDADGDVERSLGEIDKEDLRDLDPPTSEIYIDFRLKRVHEMDRTAVPKYFTRYCKMRGLPTLGLHSLRRSFCTRVANYSGLNPVVAMQMTGHKEYDTYRRYVTADPEVLREGLRRANRHVCQEGTVDLLAPPPQTQVNKAG